MDPILLPTVPLVPEWLKQLLDDCDDEAILIARYNVKLLGRNARSFIWNLCASLGTTNHGVAGQACRLIERYLAARIREKMAFVAARRILFVSGSPAWMEFKQELSSRLPLFIALLIQLSSKMGNMAIRLQPQIIRTALQLRGADYTIEDILETEFEVLKIFNFRLPTWTSIETAELLATEVGMKAELLPGVALVVNLAEFYRYKLEDDVYRSIATPDSFWKIKMRTLHLVAGSVAASARYLKFKGPDPTLKLSMLTNAPHCYIICIADLVLKCLQDDKKTPIVSRKRKATPSSSSSTSSWSWSWTGYGHGSGV